MNVRTVEQWKRVLGALPSPDGVPVEQVVAQRVLGDLVGYNYRSRNRVRDAEELANVLTAWSEMNQGAFDEAADPPRRHASDEYADAEAGDDT